MAAGTEFWLVRKWNGGERHRSGHETQYDRTAKLPAHAPIEHVEENAS